mmetsp:Transcript_54638/g.169484  ORF Transcript_54638/g.169484 Transcript_54638/m.169484 type:complete len:207 (-) Transcript_54638:18-638(-)
MGVRGACFRLRLRGAGLWLGDQLGPARPPVPQERRVLLLSPARSLGGLGHLLAAPPRHRGQGHYHGTSPGLRAVWNAATALGLAADAEHAPPCPTERGGATGAVGQLTGAAQAGRARPQPTGAMELLAGSQCSTHSRPDHLKPSPAARGQQQASHNGCHEHAHCTDWEHLVPQPAAAAAGSERQKTAGRHAWQTTRGPQCAWTKNA